MAGRDDRLRQPGQFIEGLSTRPVIREGAFVIHVVQSSDHTRLGMVIPKRWIKQATRRNQIKRWVREAFRSVLPQSPVHVIFRVRSGLGVAGWAKPDREGVRAQILKAFRLFQTLQTQGRLP